MGSKQSLSLSKASSKKLGSRLTSDLSLNQVQSENSCNCSARNCQPVKRNLSQMDLGLYESASKTFKQMDSMHNSASSSLSTDGGLEAFVGKERNNQNEVGEAKAVKESIEEFESQPLSKQGENTQFKWEFGGENVYLSLLCEESSPRREKMVQKETQFGETIFQVDLDLAPGVYYYYYIIDGEDRYDPSVCTTTNEDNQIINCIVIQGNKFLINMIKDIAQNLSTSNLNCGKGTQNDPSSFSSFNSFDSWTLQWSDETLYDDTTTTQQQTPTNQPPQTMMNMMTTRRPATTCLKQASATIKVKPQKVVKKVHFQDMHDVHGKVLDY